MARVLNRYKHPIPDNAVYIGRPSKWGNPFEMTGSKSRETSLADYEDWLMTQPELIAAAKKELVGRDLVCFCAPKACHGDFLLKIANSQGTENE